MITTIQTKDQDWVLEGLKRNDPRITKLFYQQLRRKTTPYFLSRYGRQHQETLEDCLSDAFLILLRKVQNGQYEHRKLEAFAFGIVKNTFRDAFRRAQRPEQTTAPEELPECIDLPQEVTYASAKDWVEDFDHQELLTWFSQLTDREQNFLNLQLKGYQLKEIAALSELSYGTVRNVFSRMMKRARNAVAA